MFVLSHYQYDKYISHEYESDMRPDATTRTTTEERKCRDTMVAAAVYICWRSRIIHPSVGTNE